VTKGRGKFIVIEGTDGAGKGTQAELLIDAMRQFSTVTYFDFPRYTESVFGQVIGRALNGEFGNFLELNPYLSSLPYMLDRASARDPMCKALEQGHIVCNRYTTSSIAFQSSKLPLDKRNEFITFVESAEYGELGIPKPDLILFLYVSAVVSDKLVEKKAQRSYIGKGQKDLHEQDRNYQTAVAETYHTLARWRPDWHVIDCMDGDGILPVEKIHQKILSFVFPLIDPTISVPETVHCAIPRP